MFQWLHELLLEEPEKPTVTAEELPDDPDEFIRILESSSRNKEKGG